MHVDPPYAWLPQTHAAKVQTWTKRGQCETGLDPHFTQLPKRSGPQAHGNSRPDSYGVISYRISSNYILSYHSKSHRAYLVPYLVELYLFIPQQIASSVSCTVSRRTISFHTVVNRIERILYRFSSNYVLSYRSKSHRIQPYHIESYRGKLHRIKSYHIESHRSKSHLISSHLISSHRTQIKDSLWRFPRPTQSLLSTSTDPSLQYMTRSTTVAAPKSSARTHHEVIRRDRCRDGLGKHTHHIGALVVGREGRENEEDGPERSTGTRTHHLSEPHPRHLRPRARSRFQPIPRVSAFRNVSRTCTDKLRTIQGGLCRTLPSKTASKHTPLLEDLFDPTVLAMAL